MRPYGKVRANLLSKFYPVIFITMVVLLMGSLLALTDSVTRAELESQQDQQTLEILKEIFPKASFYVLEDDIYIIYDYSGDDIGYAFLAEGRGYRSDIFILVGLEDKETIKGITVISHNETWPTSGEEDEPIDFSSFVDQFIGLKIDDCNLKKDDGQVDSITRATKSSKAVVDIVRETALEKVKSIR